MNAKPLVSVLVITYNQKDYIAKTLDCLLMQVCPFDYEILVGEDCSTDGTRAICEDYARRYPDKIRLFLNASNKGLVNNYFDLLDEATGYYLADCGGDDYWLTTDKLAKQVALMKLYPTLSMVAGNWQKYDQKTGNLETNLSDSVADWYQPGYMGVEAVKDYLNKRNFPRIVLGTSVFRADWMKEQIQRFPELFRGDLVVCEDLPMILCLLLKGPIYLMKEELMTYRVLEKSTSHSDSLKDFSYPVFIETLDLIQKLGLPLTDVEPYLKKELPNLVFSAFLTNDQSWMREIAQDLKKYGVKWGFKQKIQYSCTINQCAHAIVYTLYRALKK